MDMYREKALGMIEVIGRLGDIEALDAALKAADVSLVSMVKVGGGLTTVFVEGEVAAVKASVDAGTAAAERVSRVLSSHVIPRPDRSVRKMLDPEMPFGNGGGPQNEERPEETEAGKQQTAEKENAPKEDVQNKKETSPGETEKSAEVLKKMTVSALRKQARETKNFPMTRGEIRYARKKDLLDGFRSLKK